MAAINSKFSVGQELALSGKPMKVTGLVQYDAGNGALITRYALAAPTGPLILQDDAGLALLRPFPPAAQPTAQGGTVSVMGEKYELGAVRKLKTLGIAGEPPPGTPKAPLVLSAQFKGNMGMLLREVVPGATAQSYFLVKPVGQGELLTGEELAKLREAERVVAELNAQAIENEAAESEQKPWVKVAVWIVIILVIVALVYACSGSSDDSSSSSGSVRVGTGHSSHGGK